MVNQLTTSAAAGAIVMMYICRSLVRWSWGRPIVTRAPLYRNARLSVARRWAAGGEAVFRQAHGLPSAPPPDPTGVVECGGPYSLDSAGAGVPDDPVQMG